MNNVWLVTGSASGLGRNIAEAVLESGHGPKTDNRLSSVQSRCNVTLRTVSRTVSTSSLHAALGHHLDEIPVT
jgi:NAD(P)-dependent dehydrogenase (short-subunit alcohol dehydrogenase family)